MTILGKHCKACNVHLPLDARFCHQCGKQVDLLCPECGKLNLPEARFCQACGYPINLVYQAPKAPEEKKTRRKIASFSIDFEELQSLPQQLSQAFLAYISRALSKEGQDEKELLYLDAFETRNFRREVFEEEALLLAQELETAYLNADELAFSALEEKIEGLFAQLYMQFLLLYTKDFLPQALSPRVLRYYEQDKEGIELSSLIRDFLQIEQEPLRSYTQAIQIPLKTLGNAKARFYFPQPGELPLLFIDTTLLGSGKEGLVLSDRAIYWKSYMHQAEKLAYSEIHALKRKSNYIEINELYFNSNESLNYKLFKLLQFLKKLYGSKKQK